MTTSLRNTLVICPIIPRTGELRSPIVPAPQLLLLSRPVKRLRVALPLLLLTHLHPVKPLSGTTLTMNLLQATLYRRRAARVAPGTRGLLPLNISRRVQAPSRQQ